MIIKIESPVTVGDKVYRTNQFCDVLVGEVTQLTIIKQYSEKNTEYIRFDVLWNDSTNSNHVDVDINKLIFLSKEELIKHLSK